MTDKRHLFHDDHLRCPWCRGSGKAMGEDGIPLDRPCRHCGGSRSIAKARSQSRGARDESGPAPLSTREAGVSQARAQMRSLIEHLGARASWWQGQAQRTAPVLQLPAHLSRWQASPAEDPGWIRRALEWHDIYADLRNVIADLDPGAPDAVDTVCRIRDSVDESDYEFASRLARLESSCRAIRLLADFDR